MSDSIEFNELVDGAMVKIGNPTMRPVVEKELFHYEIFSALKHHNLLDNLRKTIYKRCVQFIVL